MTDAVQDGRRKNFFIVDNALIDAFGPVIGAYGVAVYGVLVRMAGAKGECHPAHETIAQRLNISTSTVQRALTTLAGTDPPLIKISNRAAEGLKTSNVYTLVSLDQQPAAATPAATQPQRPTVGLWDSTIGQVQDAPDHRAKLAALLRVWLTAFGADKGITPAQAENLIKAAGGDAAVVARAALGAAVNIGSEIRSPYALVLGGLTKRSAGPARRASGEVGYGTVQRQDSDTPF